jgi:uncharacterized protein YjbI with pentapeptide repeats
MSQPPKKHKKGGKAASSTASHEEEELIVPQRASAPTLSQVTRNESPEPPTERRASGSSENSDAGSPRSMVNSIIELISTRVQSQLAAFLSNEVSALLAVTRAEVTEEFRLETQKMKLGFESELKALKEQLEAQKKVQQKQEDWQAVEPVLMAEMQQQQNEYIVLNVGGVEYATSRSTMMKYPNSMLGAMFSGRYKAVLDPSGRHFIDRDGPPFRHVLNYLRTDSISTVDVTNIAALNELYQEAVYYQIDPLVQLLQVFLAKADASEHSTLHEYRSRSRLSDDTCLPSENFRGINLHATAAPVAAPSHEHHHHNHSHNHHNHHNANARASAQSNQRLLRRVSTMASPHGRRLDPLEPPVYSREEIHALKLKHEYPRSPPLNLAGLDLRGLDLSKLDVRGIDFSRCNLEGASFERARIEGCIFSEANLTRTNFQQAVVGELQTTCPDFTDAEMQGADFTRYVGVLFRSRFEGVEDGLIGLELRWLR